MREGRPGAPAITNSKGAPPMFSVVIPSHDRLDLLRDAVESVRRQDSPAWELVVFDNASVGDVKGYVASLSDARIRYVRSDAFLPVTESWNRAIDLAKGRYVTFLGDDDGLAPGYFTRMAKIVQEFDTPEVLYCAIYQFLHPGVAPWERKGYVAEVKNGFFFSNRKSAFRLSEQDAFAAVHGSVGLRRNFTFNMQAFCFHRDFLSRLRLDGPIFRSPFPDYYLANIAFAKAKTVVVIPEPMSIVGVSKASYGYTLFNGLEARGADLLNTKIGDDPLFGEIEKHVLPGPLYNTNYVLTMEHVCRYAGRYMRQGVDFGRYRRLQIYRVLCNGSGGEDSVAPLWARLSIPEKLWARMLNITIRAGKFLRLYEKLVLPVIGRFVEPYSFYPPERIIARGQYSRLMEIFDFLAVRTASRESSPEHCAGPPDRQE